MEPAHLSPATVAVTAGRPHPLPNAPLNTPVTFASTYAARALSAEPNDVGYGRWGNPTWTAFEEGLGALERGEALAFASGMAAVDAAFALVPPGGAVVIPGSVYNGTEALAPDLAATGRIQLRRPAGIELDDVLPALDGAAMLWLESPSNPLLQVADLPALIAAGHAAGALVVVDNTFATPLGQLPLSKGADVVVHSATKYLSGHSDVLMGATVSRDEELRVRLHAHRTLRGAVPGPMEAWLALRGLRTLHLRVERACANAAELARRLHAHPAISRVRHPSLPTDPYHARARAQMQTFGAVISIELADGPHAADRLCGSTQLWVDATSLGGVESTLERRRRHAAEPVAVPENLVRLSVGIEDVEDLWVDLSTTLDHC
ncbi:MAG: aminotransferase class I/II-fold pyridoxal phosphate-dependent enzyme [Kineosporiaceae bacterium]|nr:aminotransferase class I/II-fold pyridoxal phosphate-dependent enzyme [Kineosporiaceae bacterium]MBK7625401.1 aminotransferase class I/II-fold pyridoxal phosphate-dependent enzyme [Kineosporiaceae bacterium]MBK8076236.1 aminotransferase class I/II-fold pyridoxal phosphate-dependent enzyme [Kineosporiaceae bacterium]